MLYRELGKEKDKLCKYAYQRLLTEQCKTFYNLTASILEPVLDPVQRYGNFFIYFYF